MAAQTVHRQISDLSTSKHPYTHWSLLWQASSHWKKCRNGSIFKRDWSLVLFLIFLKAQATIGWIFTGKLCLCSPPRIFLGIIVLLFILSQIPSELHPCYLYSFLPIYPKIFIFWPWADRPWIKSSSLHLIYFLRFAIKELEQILKSCSLYF